VIEAERFPALAEPSARCEELAEFQRVYLPITNNLPRSEPNG